MEILRTILFRIMLAIWFLCWSPILLIGLVNRRLCYWLMMRDAAGVRWLAKNVAGIGWRAHNVPKSVNGIIASKHMSILEIAVIARTIPNTFYIIKRELLWIPIYGWAFWRMGFVGVNRAKGKTNMKDLANAVQHRIAQGMTLVIFPEGTRVKVGAGVKLRRGLLFIAEQLKIPIIPVGTDTGKFWPKRGRMRAGIANVYFEPALPYDASLEEIAAAIARHSA